MVGETSTYADYIFPDLSYLERWEFHGTHFSVPGRWRTCAIRPLPLPGWPTVTVYGEEVPMSAEAMMMAIAEKLDLPGFGPNGLGEGVPFTRPEHLYLKQVANMAFGEKEDGSDACPKRTTKSCASSARRGASCPNRSMTSKHGKRRLAMTPACGAKWSTC
jgi:tetrathionate reductase subunit A